MRMRNKKKNRYRSPFVAEKLLRMMLSDSEKEDLSGDFEEIYKDYIHEKGRVRARVRYWQQVLTYIPFFLLNLIYWRIKISQILTFMELLF